MYYKYTSLNLIIFIGYLPRINIIKFRVTLYIIAILT
jgi:hypothetical protein